MPCGLLDRFFGLPRHYPTTAPRIGGLLPEGSGFDSVGTHRALQITRTPDPVSWPESARGGALLQFSSLFHPEEQAHWLERSHQQLDQSVCDQ